MLEGNVSIRCKSMVGKMINGDSISIATSESLQVEAMYGSDAVVRAGSNVDLGLFRGQLQCEAEGDANIRGIDGQIAIQSHSGNIHLHVNSLTKGNASNHSGEGEEDADGTHTIFAEKGNISCHLDPEVRQIVVRSVWLSIFTSTYNYFTTVFHRRRLTVTAREARLARAYPLFPMHLNRSTFRILQL